MSDDGVSLNLQKDPFAISALLDDLGRQRDRAERRYYDLLQVLRPLLGDVVVQADHAGLIAHIGSLLSLLPPKEDEQVTTFTPLLWVSMTDDQKYEEYIRVRRLASLLPAQPEPK